MMYYSYIFEVHLGLFTPRNCTRIDELTEPKRSSDPLTESPSHTLAFVS